jgi:uncharacterized protein YrrD
MENVQITKKWSKLRGIAVVSLADGSKLGTCDDFFFDPATAALAGLRVKTGLLTHRLLPVSAIHMFGEDAITTAAEDALQHESDDKSVSGLPRATDLHDYKVMSAGGNSIGVVGDVILDVSTPTACRIAAFELSGGFRERLRGKYIAFPASQVQRYGQDVLVLPDEVAQSLR